MGEHPVEQVAVVVMAHPDDAEFGCAGTVAAWAREGWAVYYVVCTDASGGGSDDATDVTPTARALITTTRKAEQRAAGAILGLRDVIFLDYPDGRMEPTLDLRRDLVRVFRRLRPSRVICQSPERTWTPTYAIPRHHPDHLAVGAATLAALYPATQNPWDFPELLDEGLPPTRSTSSTSRVRRTATTRSISAPRSTPSWRRCGRTPARSAAAWNAWNRCCATGRARRARRTASPTPNSSIAPSRWAERRRARPAEQLGRAIPYSPPQHRARAGHCAGTATPAPCSPCVTQNKSLARFRTPHLAALPNCPLVRCHTAPALVSCTRDHRP